MPNNKHIAVAFALAVAVILVAIWLRSRSANSGDRGSMASTRTEQVRPEPPNVESRPRTRRLPDAAARTALLERIRQAKQRRVAAPDAAISGRHERGAVASAMSPEEKTDDEDDDPDRDYIQLSVEGIAPLLAQCYEQGREREPGLAGLIVVDFTIEGEPGVGGLVTQSTVDPKESDIRDDGVRECIQESLYAIEIEPPTNGGVVTVHYPFRFGLPD